MDLNSTPSANRTHIGIFGKRNAGKSSLINALTNQDIAIVSEQKGTTTDPVSKAMELLPLGPVMIIDTPGIDDEGTIGMLRVKKAYQVLNKTDIALLVIDGLQGPAQEDIELLKHIQNKGLPVLIVYTKATLISKDSVHYDSLNAPFVWVDSLTKTNINELRDTIATLVPQKLSEQPLLSDIVNPGETVILVTPIDSSAPKGRLILPQQQVIRALLDIGAVAIVTRETELKEVLAGSGKNADLVITDSQAFGFVAKTIPVTMPLTSFSILFARFKGDLRETVHGAKALQALNDGNRVLISEGCSHHRQCLDIGTVKLPTWIKQYTGKNILFEWTSGTEFPCELSPYKMIIHCGGCMLTEREMQYRIKCAVEQSIPISNYGITIALINGILPRALAPFPNILAELQ